MSVELTCAVCELALPHKDGDPDGEPEALVMGGGRVVLIVTDGHLFCSAGCQSYHHVQRLARRVVAELGEGSLGDARRSAAELAREFEERFPAPRRQGDG